MFEAEVVVAVQGLEYVIDLVLSELMVEGVSRAVIQNLQEDGVDRSTIRHLLPMLTNSQEVSINVAFCLLVGRETQWHMQWHLLGDGMRDVVVVLKASRNVEKWCFNEVKMMESWNVNGCGDQR
ncbi:hypothetical protein V6N12_028782 [Hibiscus sabdariffa]|uniref:Uncharacterized protein n=1 Tax=Hibiscus sabdariffa TaxID=183260 RepID=A0ABR2F6S6_9ROSI